MKKFSNTEAELEKALLIKKTCILFDEVDRELGHEKNISPDTIVFFKKLLPMT